MAELFCKTCERWAATSLLQWRNRMSNIRQYPECDIAKCPNCGSADWAITRAFIREESESDTDRRIRAVTWRVAIAFSIAVWAVIIYFIGWIIQK